MQISQVDADTVRPLRHEVLRFGLPLSESVYPQDALADTVHLAALEDGRVVGVATVFPEPYEDEPAWRLRGMAVAEDRRGSGVGSRLLREVVTVVGHAGVDTLWCNARSIALPFYLAHGFTVVGDEFLAAHDIPHHVAVLALRDA